MFVFEIQRHKAYQDVLTIYDAGMKEVFITSNMNTYPDRPQDVGIHNDGLPDATLENGYYLLKEKLQEIEGDQWRVLEVVRVDGGQEVPVLRRTGRDTSTGINIHFRRDNELHLTFANSTGCLTLPMDEFKKMREIVGMTNEAFETGRVIGFLHIHGQPSMDAYRGKVL